VKKRLLTLLLAICFAIIVTGCGENKELTKYKKEMDKFYSNVEIIHNKINSIDYDSDNALDELFICLNDLDKEFRTMAALDVPAEFASLETLADEASENMTLAVTTFQEAYSKESYNEYTAATAFEYYERANKRFQYMIDILHGNMPEGSDVTVTEITQ